MCKFKVTRNVFSGSIRMDEWMIRYIKINLRYNVLYVNQVYCTVKKTFCAHFPHIFCHYRILYGQMLFYNIRLIWHYLSWTSIIRSFVNNLDSYQIISAMFLGNNINSVLFLPLNLNSSFEQPVTALLVDSWMVPYCLHSVRCCAERGTVKRRSSFGLCINYKSQSKY